MNKRERLHSAEAKFYTWVATILGSALVLGPPILLDLNIIQDSYNRDLIMIIYGLGMILLVGVIGLFGLGWVMTELQGNLPITHKITVGLGSAAVAVVVVAVGLAWFFVVIPLAAFVAACLSSAKKVNKWK